MENSILQLFPSGSRALWQSVAKKRKGTFSDRSGQAFGRSGRGASGHGA